jgi:hypothetical protein
MSYAMVGSPSDNSHTVGTVSSISVTRTVTPGTVLIIAVSHSVTSTVTMSDSGAGAGNTYVQAVTPKGISGNNVNELWYVQSSVGGSTTITANFSPVSAYVGIHVEEFSGLGSYIGAVGNYQASPGTGTAAVTSTAFSVTPAPAMFWGWGQDINGNAYVSATAMWTNTRNTVFNTGGLTNVNVAWACDTLISSPASTAATFTLSTNDPTTAFAIAFQVSVAPAPYTPFTQTQFFVTDTVIQS